MLDEQNIWPLIVDLVGRVSPPLAGILRTSGRLSFEGGFARVSVNATFFKMVIAPGRSELIADAIEKVTGVGYQLVLSSYAQDGPAPAVIEAVAEASEGLEPVHAALAPLESFEVRKTWHDERWFFSVVDVVAVLAESADPSKYWSKMKKREAEALGGSGQLSPIWRKLPLLFADGKNRSTDCADTEGILRIIQSIPSPKAEPFKRWLAQIGRERLEEEAEPGLILDRAVSTYKRQGRDTAWVSVRVRGKEVRVRLTSEWDARGIMGREYGLMTAQLSRAIFRLTPSEHATFKRIGKRNVRDHFTTEELTIQMLGEMAALALHQAHDSQGRAEISRDIEKAGQIARNALMELEAATGRAIVSSQNFLPPAKTPKELPPPEPS